MPLFAKHHVKISGRKYMPGEKIDIPVPEEKLDRLLRLKAVERKYDVDTNSDDKPDIENNGDGHNCGDSAGCDDSSDNSEDAVEEAFEDAEAPDIDVMDGIVAEPPDIDVMDAIVAEPENGHPKKNSTRGRKKHECEDH